jgi:hypothetical protein
MMNEENEIKPKLFKVASGNRHFDIFFILAYTANEALQIALDRNKNWAEFAENIQTIECLNVRDGFESEILIAPECIQGGLQNKKV